MEHKSLLQPIDILLPLLVQVKIHVSFGVFLLEDVESLLHRLHLVILKDSLLLLCYFWFDFRYVFEVCN
jgi:hypothetical protein